MAKDTHIQVGDEYFVSNGEGFGESLRGILNDYYENEMQELSKTEQELARRFIEEGLIVGGRRVGITEGVEKERYGISPELLKKLLDSRLIRVENTHLGRSFEVSHDTLVEPILESYEQRKAREEALRRKEEEEKRQKELRKARMRFLGAVGLAVLGFALAGIAWHFYNQTRKVNEQLEETNNDLKQATQEILAAQEERDSLNFVRYFELGKSNYRQGEYQLASYNLDFALRSDSIHAKADSARMLKIESDKLSGTRAYFDRYMNEGETAMRRSDFVAAIQAFRKARDLNLSYSDTQSAEVEISKAKNKLVPEVRNIIVNKIKIFYDGEKSEPNGKFEFTRQWLRRLNQLLPYIDKKQLTEDELEIVRKAQQAVN